MWGKKLTGFESVASFQSLWGFEPKDFSLEFSAQGWGLSLGPGVF